MNNSRAGSARLRLAGWLPFYYGWVIVANAIVVSFSARTVMAVATLSVFVVPMTEQLGCLLLDHKIQYLGGVMGSLHGIPVGGGDAGESVIVLADDVPFNSRCSEQ